ncbi:nickel/cobalt transporter [Vibrio sp. Sgm 22]|uniref:nickel/cobalt transporter n=1 Tax=unclassified Vibrio TaxID=2614977 RepID=UPI0022487741|nr:MULTISPECIES: nickel/cobalt transporter [unclassified Vibrio]MCX2757868.1 nickel/cobalt transporter [Vibrio sp. 14G-20]MCX2774853.1 nickel/cobalt transporter [Vibrio sp. Sgm 22]
MKKNQSKLNHYLIGAGAFVLIAIGAYQLWSMWPSLVISSIQWQREVNSELADLLYEAKSNPWGAGSYLIGFSFIYGMLHSLGPGHGKVIVSTYLATHPTKAKASLVLTIVSAFLQALVAIVLVSVLIWGFSASMRVVNDKANMFVSLSFALVAVVGALICWKALKNIYTTMRKPKLKVKTITTLVTDTSSPISVQSPMAFRSSVSAGSMMLNPSNALQPTEHSHADHSQADCGCGHQHVADADAINKASTLREYAGIIVTIGVRPCTGAIMVLLFANMVGLYWMGVLSAFAMAVGTALTTSLIAMMTLTGKHLVKRYLAAGNKNSNASLKTAGHYLQLFGGILLVLIGLLLMNGQDSGMSPVFTM